MNKKVLRFFMFLLVVFTLCSCNSEKVSITGHETITVKKGETINLDLTITGTSKNSVDSIIANLKYSSNDTKVVEINGTTVKAVGVGEAIVTVKWTEDPTISHSTKVIVEDLPITDVKVNGFTSIAIGESRTITYECAENVTNVEWKSSNEKIATVKSGVVTAIAQGKVTITLVVSNSVNRVEKTIEIEVFQNVASIIYDLDGGNFEGEVPSTYVIGTGLAELPTPIKEGYKFLGWYRGDEKVENIGKEENETINLKAKWELIPVPVKVEYELNSGSWSWTTGEVTNPKNGIDSVSNLPEIFMSEFYYYLVVNNLLDSPTVHQSLREKAYTWEDFSKNQGDPVALYNNTSTGYYSAHDGYSELFWDSMEDGIPTGGFFGTSPYKEKYANLLKVVIQLTAIRYSDLPQSSINYKAGFSFILDGYFYGTQGLMKKGTNYETFNFLRGVIPTPTITYNGTTKQENVYEIAEAEPNSTINLVAPVREGYAFVGWYTNKDFTGSPVTSVSKSATVYAKWYDLNAPLPTHKINYVLDGGTLPEGAPTEYSEGKGLAELPVPTKTNHIFLGWVINLGTNDYVTEIKKTSKVDVTLYAVWKEYNENERSITYIYEEGELPTHEATSLEEFTNTFFEEFYAWSGQTVGLEKFKAAAYASWKGGAAGNYKVYKQDGKGVIDEGYFVNAKANAQLWMAWLDEFDKQVNSINGAQTAWGSTYVGYLRLYAFFNQTASYWNAERTAAVYKAYPIKEKLITKYTVGEETPLVELVINDGRTFLGWFDEEGNRVTTITKDMNKDLVLTARWSASTPVESFEIVKVDKLLKLTSHQLTWTFTPSDATNKRLKFASSNTNILTVDENGLLFGVNTGKATVTVTVLDNEKFNVSFEVEVYTDPFIDIQIDGLSVIDTKGTTYVKAVLYAGTGNIKFKSSDDSIATVDETGLVTAVSAGSVEITAYLEGNEDVKMSIVIVILEDNVDEIFNIIARAHNNDIHVTRDLNVAYAYPADVFTSVSDLLFNYDYFVDESLIIPLDGNHANRPGTKIDTMEFITVHYTAGTPKSSNARATANYFNNTTAASANYCTGNDGIFMCIPDGEVAWHAGDGTSTKFTWTNTGVEATANVKPVWGVIANSSSSTGYYFTLNGQATTIEVPTTGVTSSGTKKTMVDPSKCFTFYGPAWKVVDGYYYMGTTWACFTQTLAGAISSRGGNLNSVGIETACNFGSDLWYTYQITAQLVTRLLYKYNLDTTRVVGHNMFSGKDCPQTLLANGGELWYKFMECVEAEYELYAKSNNYTITCKSNNPDILQDNGRIINIPNYTQTVSYTVTVQNKTTGVSQSKTFTTIVHGVYTEK